MNRRIGFYDARVLLITLIVAALCFGARAEAQDSAETAGAIPLPATVFGSLRGITVGPDGLALGGVVVTIHATDGPAQRQLVTGEDGTFLVNNLRPGSYALSAVKLGFASAPESRVDVAKDQTADAKLALLTAAESAIAPVLPSPAPATSSGNFFHRLARAYADDWKGSSAPGPEPKYRGYPAPVSAPPFPFSIWPYGGSVTVGYPFTQAGPLMTAVWGGARGDWWKKKRNSNLRMAERWI